jgi:hypothetical protein
MLQNFMVMMRVQNKGTVKEGKIETSTVPKECIDIKSNATRRVHAKIKSRKGWINVQVYGGALEVAGLEANGTTRRWVRCAKMRINNEFMYGVERRQGVVA